MIPFLKNVPSEYRKSGFRYGGSGLGTHSQMSEPNPSTDENEGGEQVRHCSKCLAIYRSEFTRCPVDGAHVITSSSDPMIGVTIAEHYQIDELIGIGSSGRVYLAHHSRLAQRRFALKVLFGDLAATATARMRFTHEAESASRLAHPNLVSVVDFGRTPAGLLYLAMDYIEGPTLAQLIAREGAMPQERAVRIALQLCRGLAHAHDLGLVHRDFKPDNILVSNDAHGDVPRIVDFGIALSAMDHDADPRLTAMGVTLGTPAYAAPEQATDGEVDLRADLFALGVTLYELLTGYLPFNGSLVEMMRLNATVDPPPMMERNPAVTVTSPLQQVVARLMARDPAHRYQTAREALEALTELPRRPGAVTRPSSMNLPTVPGGGMSGGRMTPAGPVAAGTVPPPSKPTSIPSRRSTPSIPTNVPMRQSSPVIPSRYSTPSMTTPMSAGLPVRRSTPSIQSSAVPSRQSSPVIGRPGSGPMARQSQPIMGMRPSSPSMHPSSSRQSSQAIAPLVMPSSTPPRMPSQPVIAVPEHLQRSSKIELAPLVTPIEPLRPRMLTLVLAVMIAAAVSAAAVIGYQRYARSHEKPAPAAPAAPASAP
jgi:eukaryotic-like serine/threonine-protein kinase